MNSWYCYLPISVSISQKLVCVNGLPIYLFLTVRTYSQFSQAQYSVCVACEVTHGAGLLLQMIETEEVVIF